MEIAAWMFDVGVSLLYSDACKHDLVKITQMNNMNYMNVILQKVFV